MKLKSTLKRNNEVHNNDLSSSDSSSSEDEDDDSGSISDNDDDDDDDDDEDDDDDDEMHEAGQSPALQATLAKRESKAVLGMRLLVFGVLIVTTVAVAALVNYYTASSERSQFQASFAMDAQKVLQGIGTSLAYTLGGADAMVVSMVSYANATNQTWPFVTIPDFGVRADKIMGLTNAIYISMLMYVAPGQRYQWQNYSAEHGKQWVEQTLDLQKRENMYQTVIKENNFTNVTYFNVIYDNNEFSKPLSEQGKVGESPNATGPFMPGWQIFPLIPYQPPYNWDILSLANDASMQAVFQTHQVSICGAQLIAYPNDTARIEENKGYAKWISYYLPEGVEAMEPDSNIYYPILKNADDWINVNTDYYDPKENNFGGVLDVTFYWRDLIKGILPEGTNGIIVVFESPCNPTFTYQINGPDYQFWGTGDFHESRFDHMEVSSPLSGLGNFSSRGSSYSGIPVNHDSCPFTIRVYPSSTLEAKFVTNSPIIFTVVAVLIFVFTSAIFIVYDWYVERRQAVVMATAVRSDALVTSLFPQTVKDRLYMNTAAEQKRSTDAFATNFYKPSTQQGDFNGKNDEIQEALPIADLFQDTTVLFADLVGFTAWSSTREPTQVFSLLEALYGAFDRIAKRRGVFKVETVGDCYVAVTGLPEPRRNHAVAMARFASDIRETSNSLTRELELKLGPGTGELRMRIGLHSGSVTAGVLRGEKSRFQLFGDTVNTAARMESSGIPNYIHASQKTADLLLTAGKGEWLTARDTVVEVKGKGKMQTYLVEPSTGYAAASHYSSDNTGDSTNAFISEVVGTPDTPMEGEGAPSSIDCVVLSTKEERLIDWNTTMFKELLRKLVANRMALGEDEKAQHNVIWTPTHEDDSLTARDEVVESIDLPPFRKVNSVIDAESIELPEQVVQQLHHLISTIARSYRGNAFHNFSHASHVTMCTKKLLQRITTLSNTLSQHEIYVHSFGIATDPMAHFTVCLAAIVHDIDHPGVSNAQLIKEDTCMAARYQQKSVAEQNSLDIAWNLLMEPTYDELRAFLFATQDELNRFRQLLVNFVMATDIFDPDLKSLRDQRWQDAFSESARSEDANALKRKATIVLEHAIQASDVSHTMQHWTIYQKWNRCLFEEMYVAYKAGRSDKDPTVGWYQGELWFFDNYVIPLAKKLMECQVFGASSHEFLDNAYDNRLEWENKGQAIVEEMKELLDRERIEL